MKIKKLSWLGALVAFAAVVGAVGLAPSSVKADTGIKTCVAGAAGSNQIVCTLTIAITPAPEAAGVTRTITINAGVTATLQSVTVAGGTTCPTTITTVGVGGFTTSQPVACPAGSAVVLTETLNVLAPGGGALSQTETNTSGNPNAGVIAATNPGGGAFAIPAFTVLPTGFTKVCSTTAGGAQVTTVAVGTPIFCTVTVAPATASGGTATITLTNGLFTATGINTATVAFVAGTFAEPSFTATTAGVVPTQTITLNGVTLGANTNITSVTAAAGATTNIVFNGCSTAIPPIFGVGAGTNTVVPGTPITCNFLFTDGDAVPGAVSSGLVTVTQQGNIVNGTLGVVSTNLVGGVVVGTPNQVGNSTTIRCGAPTPGAAAPETCTSVSITFTGAQTNLFTNLPQIVGITIGYVPDLPAVNTTANQTFANIFTIAVGVGALVQPTIILQCTSSGTLTPNNSNLVGVIVPPGPITLTNLTTSNSIFAVSVLPAVVPCQVIGAGTFAAPIGVAPGTFEISSVNGVLLDASGRLSTNLRIACGDGSLFFGQAVIALNTCFGVQFSVAGQGVGNVEVRVRYEPSSFSAANGIQEREGAGLVTFVAPTVSVALTISPNPIAVAVNPNAPIAANGEVGTATAIFNRTFNCSAVVGIATIAPQICINPTTGLPITLDFGSALNGTVIFQIDNTAIARFLTNLVSTQGIGTSINNSSSQVAVRCGAFSSGAQGFGNFGNSNLSNFFGGCDTASVQYVGVNPGSAQIAALFIPDLPGATTGSLGGAFNNILGGGGSNFFNTGTGGFGGLSSFSQRTIQVTGAPLATTQVLQLARGCNNITPTVSESATAYAARVSPASAVNSIFQFVTATNVFLGAAGPGAPAGAAAVSDLASVTRLVPVFVCVSQAATLTQPTI